MNDKGHLIGFDQDADALANVAEDARFSFAHSNYKYLRQFLRLYGHLQVDGILADLGVSSHQFDEATRGFTFRQDSQLDMRMNQTGEKTAVEILNTYSPEEIQQVLSEYGEVRNAKTVALKIWEERKNRPIATSSQLLQLLGLFQALRIEVNDEINSLKLFLQEAAQVLKPEGRLVIISYHSLEDRVVKKFFKAGNFEGIPEKDFYGNMLKPFKVITRKPLLPSAEEINRILEHVVQK